MNSSTAKRNPANLTGASPFIVHYLVPLIIYLVHTAGDQVTERMQAAAAQYKTLTIFIVVYCVFCNNAVVWGVPPLLHVSL